MTPPPSFCARAIVAARPVDLRLRLGDQALATGRSPRRRAWSPRRSRPAARRAGSGRGGRAPGPLLTRSPSSASISTIDSPSMRAATCASSRGTSVPETNSRSTNSRRSAGATVTAGGGARAPLGRDGARRAVRRADRQAERARHFGRRRARVERRIAEGAAAKDDDGRERVEEPVHRHASVPAVAERAGDERLEDADRGRRFGLAVEIRLGRDPLEEAADIGEQEPRAKDRVERRRGGAGGLGGLEQALEPGEDLGVDRPRHLGHSRVAPRLGPDLDDHARLLARLAEHVFAQAGAHRPDDVPARGEEVGEGPRALHLVDGAQALDDRLLRRERCGRGCRRSCRPLPRHAAWSRRGSHARRRRARRLRGYARAARRRCGRQLGRRSATYRYLGMNIHSVREECGAIAASARAAARAIWPTGTLASGSQAGRAPPSRIPWLRRLFPLFATVAICPPCSSVENRGNKGADARYGTRVRQDVSSAAARATGGKAGPSFPGSGSPPAIRSPSGAPHRAARARLAQDGRSSAYPCAGASAGRGLGRNPPSRPTAGRKAQT